MSLEHEDAFNWLDASLEELRYSDLMRTLRISGSASTPEMKIAGQQVVQFSSNNYLGLATHPRVIEAAQRALHDFGTGTGASRLLSGTQQPHAKLEEALASFKGAEAALVFSTGSMANTGLLPCLVGEGDWVLLDKADHATLYDGARLSGAEIKRFPHHNLKRLESLLKEAREGHTERRILVAVEGVYSMDGDIAPLPDIFALAEEYGAMVLVDEAHATGVLGEGGHGSLEHFGLRWPSCLVMTGTLSKALGSLGGFVAGSRALVDWVINKSRGFIFATSLPAACAVAASEALKIIAEEPQRLIRLHSNREHMAQGLEKLGWNLLSNQSAILPVQVGQAQLAVELQQRLWSDGFYAPAIRPPTVPAALCRIRLSLTAEHTESHIDGFLRALGPHD